MKRLSLLYLYFLASFSYAQSDCSTLTISGPAEYPPYLWQAKLPSTEVKGASFTMLEYLTEKSGLQFQMIYTGSWARTQMELESGSLVMLTGLFYNDERAKVMDFLQPAYAQSNARIWVHKDQEKNISSLEQLQKLQGATQIGFSLGRTFDNYAKENLQLSRVRSITQAFKMLESKRVDYVAYEEQPGIAILNGMGSVAKHLKMLPMDISSEGIYLSVAKKSACNKPEVIEPIQKALRELNKTQTMEKLVQEAQAQWKAESIK